MRVDDVACLQERRDKMVIAAPMFPKSVEDYDNGPRGDGRPPDVVENRVPDLTAQISSRLIGPAFEGRRLGERSRFDEPLTDSVEFHVSVESM